jgi:hypothetical protein
MNSIELGVELGAKIYVFGWREGTETDSAEPLMQVRFRDA